MEQAKKLLADNVRNAASIEAGTDIALAAAGADVFVATSDNPRSEDPPAIVAQMLAGVLPEHRARALEIVDRAAAIAHAVTTAAPEDLVLIAGKGHEDYQILAHGKIHFDDREHAAQALAARPVS